MKLENKVALITGSSRGIGKAIAIEFSKEGASVVINYNKSEKEALELVNKINENKNSLEAIAAKADISKISDISNMVEQVLLKHQKIDILINNAYIYYRNSFFDCTEEIWDSTIKTNLRGTYFCSQIIGKKMFERKDGIIINIASNSGIFPKKSKGIEYSISKAGIIYLTKSLAITLAPYIRVNCISPGYTYTERSKFFKNDGLKKEIENKIPLRRINTPEDIAKAAIFLASKDSNNMTGQNIIVDGGYSLI